MNTRKIQTLKINELTQIQYNRELKNGNINKDELYLTPDVVDQDYNANSENAQSGKAVAQAVKDRQAKFADDSIVSPEYDINRLTFNHNNTVFEGNVRFQSPNTEEAIEITNDGIEIQSPSNGNMPTQPLHIANKQYVDSTNWQTLCDITVALTEGEEGFEFITAAFKSLKGYTRFVLSLEIPKSSDEEVSKTIKAVIGVSGVSGSIPIYYSNLTTESTWIGNAFIFVNGNYVTSYHQAFARHLGINSSPAVKAYVNKDSRNTFNRDDVYLKITGMNFPNGTRVIFGGSF